MTLATLLGETTARVPDRVALVFEGSQVTYAELDAMAETEAPAGRVVPLTLPNVPVSVAAYHGTLRHGAVVIPLNPLLTPVEIEQRSRPFDPAPDTAVALFTSGTTGEPKRIELSHRVLRANAEYLAGALGLTEDDVIWGSAPLSHVFGMTGCMNAAIALGATLVLARRFDARDALETMERHGVSVFMGVPAMLTSLAAAASLETGRRPKLRLAHCGGAPLPLETQRAFEETFGAPVLEGYGMTEAGGVVALNHAGATRKPGSVGTAAAGQELRIADDGEVLVGLEGRWIATGDIGYLDEGHLFLLDRKKDVILRGGYTVYPREVEEALHQHPAVREAVVVGVPHVTLGEEIVALVVLDAGADVDAVKAHARERVAAYKYPRIVVAVDELPHGATGKIQRSAIDREQLAKLVVEGVGAPRST